MTDPFRQLFLDQVQVLLRQDPGREPLHDILRMATPDLDVNDLDLQPSREKLVKSLKLRIHPDKHPGDKRATKIFQDVGEYIDQCVLNLPNDTDSQKKKQNVSSPRKSSEFPFDFHVHDKWTFLTNFKHPRRPKAEIIDENWLSPMVGYQCINARGAIAHGAIPECTFKNDAAKSVLGFSIRKLFETVGKGARVLDTIKEIKGELRKRGPVVSVSFVPTEPMVEKTTYPEPFFNCCIGKEHPILIVGWKLTEQGECWITQPLHKEQQSFKSRTLEIAFGQFNIDDLCLAPESKFGDVPWQEGPYFDIALKKSPRWRRWPAIQTELPPGGLEKLGECLDQCLYQAVLNKSVFTIRDESHIARSKKGYLEEVKWLKKEKIWQITLRFV